MSQARTQSRRNTRSTPRFTSFLHPQLMLLEDRSVPAITGLVFLDFNANGDYDPNVVIANNGQGTTPVVADRGLEGVSVTAYNAASTVVGNALSDALGNYVLNVSGSGPFRVEFTGLPAGIHFGPQGNATSGSAIQFVAGDGATGVNLAVVRPEDFSPVNATLVTSSYVIGGIEDYDLNPGNGVILGFPYSAGSADSDPIRANHQNPTTHALSVAHREVGATWGLTYNPQTDNLYAAAFMKRTSGFGPDGPGAIYSMATVGTTADLFADLNSIFPDSPAGNLNALYTDSNGNPVPFRQGITNANYWFFDGLTRFTDADGVVRELGWDAVGKLALGGLDVNAAGTQMYTVALGDRRLYSLPTSGTLSMGTVQRFNLPIPASVTGRTLSNPLGDLRPFAVEFHRGIVYVGAVNSAESTQNTADLKAYVFAFDPATGQFLNANRQATTSQAVIEINLNYERGAIHLGQDPTQTGSTPPDPAEWNPWVPVHRLLQQQPEALGRSGYPQPMLTGLAFDGEGNLVLGLRDRSGDQVGRNVPIDPDDQNNFSYFSITAGDTLRAFINQPGNLDAMRLNPATPFAGWTLESNGRSPDGRTGTGPQNTGQGPGGGEFYSDDDFPHDPGAPPTGFTGAENDEVSTGGVLHVPGVRQTLSTAFDPVRIPGAVNGGGVRWYDSNTGRVSKTYELYVTAPANGNNTFAKGNGVGDLVLVTNPPPIEIGNFIWRDGNENGVQDAGEAGIGGVTVEIYGAGPDSIIGNADDILLASTVTDANGNYIFSNGLSANSNSRRYGLGLLADRDYQIRVNPNQAVLEGLVFTGTTTDSTSNGTSRDSNVNALGVMTVHSPLLGISNHTFDIGLVEQEVVVPPPPPPPATIPSSISGYVFRDDCPVNGIREPARNEIGFRGVRVTLFGDTVEGTVNRTAFTDATGFYSFLNLPPGTYTITESQPLGFFDGLDLPGSLSGNALSDDVLQVTLGEDQHGVNYNFAEIAPNAVIGYVFQDVNQNRRLDSADLGIPNVLISITGTAFFGTVMARSLTAADSLGGLTTRTDANGRWEFASLPPGVYAITETQPADFQDFFETLQEPTTSNVEVGNDIFSTVRLCGGEIRGLLNFGELSPVRAPDNSKRNLLGSSFNGVSVLPSTSPPVSTTPLLVPLNPAFSVNTGTPTVPSLVVTAAGAGRSPLVRAFDYGSGVERFRFYAYEQSYTGGVRVATGDVDGDGVDDIVTATGQGGGPRVRIFNGATGGIIRDFFAYEPEFRGGVFVTVGDVNGDGKADVITGTEQGGGPRVTVFDGATNVRIRDFFAFDSGQRGGVRVAAGDFNRDGQADIVATAGRGTQTRVRVFDAVGGGTLSDFVPYDAAFTGGVYITAGDVTGDGVADIVTAADVGGGPHVQVFDGLSGNANYGFFADDANFRGGVRVALQDVDGDGRQEIVTGTGVGAPSKIRLWQNGATTPFEEFYAFDTSYIGGVYVG